MTSGSRATTVPNLQVSITVLQQFEQMRRKISRFDSSFTFRLKDIMKI